MVRTEERSSGASGAVLAVILGLVLASCTSGDTTISSEDTTPPTTAEPSTTTTATTATTEPTPTSPPEPTELTIVIGSLGGEALDPRVAIIDDKIYLGLIYDNIIGMTREQNDLSTETGIAEDWQVSNDGLVLTLTIRSGVLFHDGSALTADDVQFSLQRLFDEAAVTPFSGAIRNVIGEPGNIIVTDTYELEIHLVAPSFSFPHQLSRTLGGPEGMVVPKAYIERVGDEEFSRAPIGTGPYRLVERQEGSHITLEAVDDHFALGTPRFDRVTVRLIPEQTTRLAMLRTGDADVVDVGVEQAPGVRADGFTLFQKDMGDVLSLHFLKSGLEEGAIFADPRVREALIAAINRDEIIEELFGGRAVPTSNWVTSGALGYRQREPHAYDPDRARALLEEAGVTDLEFTLESAPKPGWPQMSTVAAVVGYWEAVGIKATVNFRDFGSYLSDSRQGLLPPETVVLVPFPGRPLNIAVMRALGHSEGIQAMHPYPEQDALVDALAQAPDVDEYSEREAAVDAYAVANFVVMPILQYGITMATNDLITDWNLGRTGLGLNFEYFLYEES